MELTTQEEVEEAIWSEVHQSRYHLAEEAPICQGALRGQFGYNVDKLAARQIRNRSYTFGQDFHTGIRKLLEAAADFRGKIPQDEVDEIIRVWQE